MPKGVKGFQKNNKSWDNPKSKNTQLKKGEGLGNTNGFKKGLIPWNKGLKGFQAGENHPNWKGTATENEKIRSSAEMKLWKKSCMRRDNFTCQKTGISGGRLVVHHINNYADFPELRFELSNGITLSYDSHNEFHKIYGKKNNTREQLLEFLNK